MWFIFMELSIFSNPKDSPPKVVWVWDLTTTIYLFTIKKYLMMHLFPLYLLTTWTQIFHVILHSLNLSPREVFIFFSDYNSHLFPNYKAILHHLLEILNWHQEKSLIYSISMSLMFSVTSCPTWKLALPCEDDVPLLSCFIWWFFSLLYLPSFLKIFSFES